MARENSKDNLIEVLEYFKAMKFDHMLTHTSMLLAACAKPMFIPQEQIDVDTQQDDNQTISAIPEIEQIADQPPKYNRHGSLTNLYNTFVHCQQCSLDKNIVFGSGDINARIMFIGDAPKPEDVVQNKPFASTSGEILTKLIEKMGFTRESVYITNVAKCLCADKPKKEQSLTLCAPLTATQIEIIAPDVIVALGKMATFFLKGLTGTKSELSISKERGVFFNYQAGNKMIPVMPTFHPDYLLQKSTEKWKVWEDAQAVLKEIANKKN